MHCDITTQLAWAEIRSDAAVAWHSMEVEIVGWMIPMDPNSDAADYFVLAAAEPCCGSCAPCDPLTSVEVFAIDSIALSAGPVRLRGRLLRLQDDPNGWRYRLEDAELACEPAAVATSTLRPNRRAFLALGAALGLAACAPGRSGGQAAPRQDESASWRASAGVMTIDMHSHAGRVTVSRDPALGAHRPFTPVSAPMAAGGMDVICLAIVTDTLVTRVSADRRRFEAWRKPEPGELYRLSQDEFARAKALVEHEGIKVITHGSALASTDAAGPRAIISAEGADFLEGRLERVDEAFTLHQLRHLQLTHYRVNELGDIQTEAPVHGGLTDFGADVVRRCNALGIVVDVAHGTFDLVKRAAAVTTKPLVLSHTALATRPTSRGRSISADHARAVAGTGGVIGVWPNSATFHDLQDMAHGFRRMADVVGVDHVGLGTDMLGFISPPVLNSYAQLPRLGSALLAAGFSQSETEQILGGNYRRVFEASVANS